MWGNISFTLPKRYFLDSITNLNTYNDLICKEYVTDLKISPLYKCFKINTKFKI
jgi:hypothetical protein